jgi:hypothetical protein
MRINATATYCRLTILHVSLSTAENMRVMASKLSFWRLALSEKKKNLEVLQQKCYFAMMQYLPIIRDWWL